MKKYLILLLTLCFITACGAKYDTITTQEEANKVNAKNEIIEEKEDFSNKVFFAFDSSTLTIEHKNNLNKVVTFLTSNKDKTIIVEGHCDERGTREYNLALGQRRAEAVKKYLVSKLVNADRIKTVSFGKEKPEFIGNGESIWSKNRRSVVVIK